LAQGQELTGRKRRSKTSLQEEKEKKQKNTLDSYRPSHGREEEKIKNILTGRKREKTEKHT